MAVEPRVAPPQAREAAPQVVDIRLEGVTKQFDDVVAVDDLSLEIEQGSFFALLGPSGCGKTTTLRMIGGFEEPNTGTIFLGDRDVVGLPPYRRDVNTVFQSYALFPHLSIFENVAFGLRRKGADRKNLRGPDGRTYAVEVGDYFRNRDGEVTEWLFKAAPPHARRGLPKFRTPRFTRTLGQWLNLLAETGFLLERVAEPRPSDGAVRACPHVQDAQVVAYFLHARVRKPGRAPA